MKKILMLLFVCGSLAGCASSSKTTKDMDYQKSPCACLGDPIIFNGQVYERKVA